MAKHRVATPPRFKRPRPRRQQGAESLDPPTGGRGAEAQAHVVICDRCALRFKIQPQRREIEGGGEEHFFACPRCGAEYVMAWITERGVELRERIAEIREELKTARGEARRTLLRQLGQVVWELEPEVAGAKG